MASRFRLAVVLWLAILALIGLRLTLSKRPGGVYPIFADAGHNWLAGEEVYHPTTPELDQYRYSPAVAAFFGPWSLLPGRTGEWPWRLLNAAVFLAGLAVWARWWWPRADVGLVWLAVIPLTVAGINSGQVNALIAGLLLCTQVAFARGHWWTAAIAVTITALLKGYPLALGLLLTLIEPRRFGLRLAACLVIGLALPFLLQRPEYVATQYAAWFDRQAADDRTVWPVAMGYRDLQMLLRVWVVDMSLRTYRLMELGLAGACATAVWLGRRYWDRRQAVWVGGALAMCWMSLAGPATESSTYVLIAPLLAWAVVEAAELPGWRRWLTFASAGLFVVAAAVVWFPRPVADAVVTTGIQPLAALLLTLLVVVQCAQKTAGHSVAPGGPEGHFLSDFGRSASSSRTAA